MNELPDDPVYRHSLRESIVAFAAWAICGVYSITYCMINGYYRTADEIELYWGIPDWILFGVFAPWALCNVFAWWYCFRFIRDEDLGEVPDEEVPAE